jgi:hypothetical protein
MNRSPAPSHQLAASREADCLQAGNFSAELSNQVALLNEHSEVFKAALATYERRRELIQVRRIQRELRAALRTRRKLIDILGALDQRFPSGPCA